MKKAGKKVFDKTLMLDTEKDQLNLLKEVLQNAEIRKLGAGEPDFKVRFDHKTIFVETETKYGWKGNQDSFNFRTLHIPGRKIKLLTYLRMAPIWFVVFNKPMTHCWVFSFEQICKNTWFTIKDTKYSKKEVFFTIPTNKIVCVPVEELEKELIDE